MTTQQDLPSHGSFAASDLDSIEPGATTTFAKTVSESDIYGFSGITGDFAGNHVNEQYMSTTPYGERIAQGMLVLGYTTAASSAFGERYRLHAVSAGYEGVRFVKPVFIGDTVNVEYTLERIDTEKRRLHNKVTVTNQHGEVVLVGVHLLAIMPDQLKLGAAQ